MIYYRKCPHCNAVIGSGHGDPRKHLGTPIKYCPNCKNGYIDCNMIEWEISPFERKLGYCFANNRIWICVFFALIGMYIGEAFDLLLFSALVGFCISFLFCCLYVKSQVDKERPLSKERVKNKEYVNMLTAAGYPVKEDLEWLK